MDWHVQSWSFTMNKSFAAATALVMAFSAPALASAFWPGTVINVSDYDTLNLRKWPASYSKVIHEYDEGDGVSLTGRCKDTTTNVSFYVDGGQSPSWKYNRMKKSNVWCQAMSPNGKLGWVRGKYVWPE
jgi:hypothetical protein